MGRRIKHKTGWGCVPAKGTKLRLMLRMLLRPEGATTFELFEVGLKMSGAIGHYFTVLRDEKGWDIRAFPCPPERQQVYKGRRKTKPPYVYKVIGRLRWDGTYRSFVDPKTYTPVSSSNAQETADA